MTGYLGEIFFPKNDLNVPKMIKDTALALNALRK